MTQVMHVSNTDASNLALHVKCPLKLLLNHVLDIDRVTEVYFGCRLCPAAVALYQGEETFLEHLQTSHSEYCVDHSVHDDSMVETQPVNATIEDGEEKYVILTNAGKEESDAIEGLIQASDSIEHIESSYPQDENESATDNVHFVVEQQPLTETLQMKTEQDTRTEAATVDHVVDASVKYPEVESEDENVKYIQVTDSDGNTLTIQTQIKPADSAEEDMMVINSESSQEINRSKSQETPATLHVAEGGTLSYESEETMNSDKSDGNERMINIEISEERLDRNELEDMVHTGTKNENVRIRVKREDKSDKETKSQLDMAKVWRKKAIDMVRKKEKLLGEAPSENGYFECKECGQVSRFRSQHLEHMKIHSEHKPFECGECGKAFAKKSNLTAHMLIHTDHKPWSCEVCMKEFRMKSQLIAHLRVHSSDAPWKCQYCNKGFKDKATKKNHEMIHTGEKPHTCHICNETFRFKTDLNIHVADHEGRNPLTCDICGKKFKKRHNYSKHLLVHTGEKKHQCTECNSRFREKSHLNRHMRLHSGVRPYRCEHGCDKAFPDIASLNKHIRTHTTAFKCSVCDKTFSQKHHATRHLMLHLSK